MRTVKHTGKTAQAGLRGASAPGAPEAAAGVRGSAAGSRCWEGRYPALLVALLTLAVYLPVLGNDFVSLDDYIYVLDNLHIRTLGPAFLRWALSDLSAGFWHPVTWISFALDYAVWGVNPLGFHLSAILLHALNTFLVFLLARDLLAAGIGAEGISRPGDPRGRALAAGVTALLFGIHPLHVESVAWVSERKDLLCGTFFLLSLISYLRYAADLRREGGSAAPDGFYRDRRYLLSLGYFVLALASKTMAVSLPVVLLILDWFPLGRGRSPKAWGLLLLEKIPFIAASLLVSLASIVAQKSIGALGLMDSKPLSTRALVACKALACYLWKMLLPVHLLPYYPYPRSVSLLSLEFAVPALLVACLSAAALLLRRSHPVWLAAWGYYLVVLLPALGIVQVGVHSMGDRFTYLPSLAPFLLAGVGTARLLARPAGGEREADAASPAAAGGPARRGSRLRRQAAAGSAVVLALALSCAAVRQIGVWKNSLVLWNYVVHTGDAFNPMAYNSRGHVYRDNGDLDRAIADYSVAVSQEPAQPEYLVSRGAAYCEKGDLERALADFDRALALSPREYLAYNNRGNLWYRRGELDRALEDFTRAIALKPAETLAYQNRGAVLERKGELERALGDYSRVLQLNPLLAGAYVERGDLYLKKGALDLAERDFLQAGNLGDRSRMTGAGGRVAP